MATLDERFANHLADLERRQQASRPFGVPHEVTYPVGEVTLPEHVAHWADERPDQPVFVCEGVTRTWAQFDEDVRRAAGGLRDLGVRPGDRVAVDLPNSLEFVVTMLAVLRIGAVHVPVNPMFTARELRYEIDDSGAAVLVSCPALMAAAGSGLTASSLRHVVMTPWGPDVDVDLGDLDVVPWQTIIGSAPDVDCARDLDALAALNYTGGTTGFPKGCEHTQRHMVYTAASSACATGYTADGGFTALCYLPIFWIAGEDLGILLPIVLGGTSVLMPRWDAAGALDLLEQHRVATMVGTVENYLELLALPGIRERDLTELRDPNAVSFVRKLDPSVRAAWRDTVGNHSLLREAAYGLTETNTFDTSPAGLTEGDRDLHEEPVFCGLPVPGTKVVVTDWETGEPVPIGEAGQILVKSPSVTTGYWNKPDATAAAVVDGWLLTGDNGRIDEAGCLHYLGRRKEMIKVKGMSVFPAEIEMALSRHAAVGSVAVVPTPDPDKGEQPVAFVTLVDESVSVDDLKEHMSKELAAYKQPVIVVVEEFPMTATGKIKKVELSERAAQAVRE